MEETLFQQVEFAPSVHHPLEQFEARDLPFHLAIADVGGAGRLHRGRIPAQPTSKALQFRQMAPVHAQKPVVECL